MRLRNFLLMMAVAAALAGFGLWNACKDDAPSTPEVARPAPRPAPTPPRPVPDPPPTPPGPIAPVDPPAPTGDGLARRRHDADVMTWRGKSISSDKVKDATKGKPYKINVYQDAGKPSVNRLKVDLDRDDKWDEKVTFDGDTITLQIAPDDDEQYRETYHWTGDGWARAANAE